jgi:tRNA pseudouridine38-40 synthase
LRTLKVTVAYDGTDFFGWQQQPTGRTVEAEIKKALYFMHKHELTIDAAGRTDSGVHASGQVISYQSDLDAIPLDRYARALNSFFPKDIRVVVVSEAVPGFHARYDARLRVYKYYILASEIPIPALRAYSWRIVHQPNMRLLNRLAAQLLGTHDFTTFSAPNAQVPNRVRTVHAASFHVEGPLLVFEIAAGAFLWKMVRSIVGSLLAFEQAGLDPQAMRERLAAKDRTLAAPTAPAWGLFLHKVVYKDERLLF